MALWAAYDPPFMGLSIIYLRRPRHRQRSIPGIGEAVVPFVDCNAVDFFRQYVFQERYKIRIQPLASSKRARLNDVMETQKYCIASRNCKIYIALNRCQRMRIEHCQKSSHLKP